MKINASRISVRNEFTATARIKEGLRVRGLKMVCLGSCSSSSSYWSSPSHSLEKPGFSAAI